MSFVSFRFFFIDFKANRLEPCDIANNIYKPLVKAENIFYAVHTKRKASHSLLFITRKISSLYLREWRKKRHTTGSVFTCPDVSNSTVGAWVEIFQLAQKTNVCQLCWFICVIRPKQVWVFLCLCIDFVYNLITQIAYFVFGVNAAFCIYATFIIML